MRRGRTTTEVSRAAARNRPPHLPPHLCVAVSSHGFGHTAQVAPILAALRRRSPALRLTVQSTLPAAVLRRFLPEPFEIVAEPADVGMAMTSSIDVDAAASVAAYAAFHDAWPDRIAAAARRLDAARPDLLLADVPYLPLAAAALRGIPAVALCSLNWADIYAHFAAGRPEAARIHAEILAAYRGADAFLVTEPGMPMADLGNRRRIGPVARLGRDRRAELGARLGVAADARLVLVSMGGIAWDGGYGAWPRQAGVHFLVQDPAAGARPDMTPLEAAGMPVIDLLASCDALVAKPGYGFFTEAACNGTAVLYVRRGDWPEEPWLCDWLHRHGRAAEIDRAAFVAGDLAGPLAALLARPAPPRPVATGVDEAVAALLRYLSAG